MKWSKKQRDQVLDLYFAECSFQWIAKRNECSSSDVKRLVSKYKNNKKDCVIRYRPVLRTVKTCEPIGKRESKFIAALREIEIRDDNIARLIGRESIDDVPRGRRKEEVSTFVDLVLAHRFLYYVKSKPVVSDTEYDAMELSANGLPGEELLKTVGNDREEDYPERIKALALYLQLKRIGK